MTVKKLVIYTDGASRGNPGPAAIGVVIHDESGRAAATISQCLGEATNNQAEYRAIIAGLEKALELGATHIELRSDSELVVQQLSGKYRVKNEALKPLSQKVEELRARLSGLSVSYIPREKNKEADKLANQALDALEKAEKRDVVAGAVTVRRATHTDFQSIIEIMSETEALHVEGVPQVFRNISSKEKLEFLDNILTDEKSELLVAESGGKLLGYIQLNVIEAEMVHTLKSRRYTKVRDVAVRQDYRRSGYGNALMQAAERWASERGIDTIELNVWEFNRGASAFYQKLGYVTSSRHMWKHIQT